MEQILIRNLPAGTKAALRARAKQRHRSVEAEARDVLTGRWRASRSRSSTSWVQTRAPTSSSNPSAWA